MKFSLKKWSVIQAIFIWGLCSEYDCIQELHLDGERRRNMDGMSLPVDKAYRTSSKSVSPLTDDISSSKKLTEFLSKFNDTMDPFSLEEETSEHKYSKPRKFKHGMSKLERNALKSFFYEKQLEKISKQPKVNLFDQLREWNEKQGYTLSSGTCDRRSWKICKNSCLRTYKSICEEYKCRTSFEDEIRKNCCRICKQSTEVADQLYAKLLKELVRVNENRMSTIVQLNKPTSFNFARLIERSDEKLPAQVDKEPIVVVLDPFHENGQLKKETKVKAMDIDMSLGDDKYTPEDTNRRSGIVPKSLEILQNYDEIGSPRNQFLIMKDHEKNVNENFHSSTLNACSRRGVKVCTRACLRAFDKTCKESYCHKRFKKKYRKHCKEFCYEGFETGPTFTDDSSDDSDIDPEFEL